MKKGRGKIASVFLVIICLTMISLTAYRSAQMKRDLALVQLTEKFVRTHMMMDGGVRTNYRDENPIREYATGRDVLSESQGLVMLYALGIQDQPLFDEALAYIRRVLDTDGLISYRMSGEYGVFTMNAALDDLRIIRALIGAASTFSEPAYSELALDYSSRLYETNAAGASLYDFYDSRHDRRNDILTLCYADFKTMFLLGETDERWRLVAEESLRIVKNGFVSDEFPLFFTSYKHHDALYSGGHIETIQALITAIHLAEINQCPVITTEYIKSKVMEGALYGRYNPDGEPLDQVRSTAVYSLAFMLGKAAGDTELQSAALGQIRRFQILDENSPLYGAYANTDTLDAYSFDNLCVLLAHVYRMSDFTVTDKF